VEVTKAREEFRCEGGRLWFMVNSQGLIEVKCRHCAARMSKELGYKVVMYHYFDMNSGLVESRTYKDATILLTGGR